MKLNSQFKAGGSGGGRLLHPHPFFKNAYGDEDSEAGPVTEKSVVEMLRQPGSMDTPAPVSGPTKHTRRIFDGVTVYVNGSTFPLVSDHRLKQILLENGASMAMHLGRRRVTHVVLGRVGGGLAGGKMEREIRRGGGGGVKFVSVEW